MNSPDHIPSAPGANSADAAVPGRPLSRDEKGAPLTPAAGRFRPVLFYALAFGIAWTAWTPLLLHRLELVQMPVPFPVVLFFGQTLGAFAPLLSLVVMQRVTGEPGFVSSVLRQIRFRRVAPVWFVLPVAIPLGIAVVTAVVHGAWSADGGITILRPEPVNDLGWALVVVIPFAFVMGMIGSPFGEEPGWRGYVFDRLAATGRGYAGSAVVAALWWLWHIPLFVVLEVPINGFSLLELAGHSLLIDSVYLLSGRNLLAAMLYHQAVNTSFMFFQARTQTIAGVAVLLGLAIGVRVLAERTGPNPRERRESGP